MYALVCSSVNNDWAGVLICTDQDNVWMGAIRIQAIPFVDFALSWSRPWCTPKQKLGVLGVHRLIQSHREITRLRGLLFGSVSFMISTSSL